jgi:hypothetical protein
MIVTLRILIIVSPLRSKLRMVTQISAALATGALPRPDAADRSRELPTGLIVLDLLLTDRHGGGRRRGLPWRHYRLSRAAVKGSISPTL